MERTITPRIGETTLDKIVKVSIIIRHTIWSLIGLATLGSIAAVFIIGPGKLMQDFENQLLSGSSLGTIEGLANQIAGTSLGNTSGNTQQSQQVNTIPNLTASQISCMQNTIGVQGMLDIIKSGSISPSAEQKLSVCFPHGFPSGL